MTSSPVKYLRGIADAAPNGSPFDAAAPYYRWSTTSLTRAQLSAIFRKDARTNVGDLDAAGPDASRRLGPAVPGDAVRDAGDEDRLGRRVRLGLQRRAAGGWLADAQQPVRRGAGPLARRPVRAPAAGTGRRRRGAPGPPRSRSRRRTASAAAWWRRTGWRPGTRGPAGREQQDQRRLQAVDDARHSPSVGISTRTTSAAARAARRRRRARCCRARPRTSRGRTARR